MVGALNLFVAYQFSEATWVSYKMWSFIPLTFFIMVITAIIMSPSLKADDTSGNNTGGS